MGVNSISREDLQLVRPGDPIQARAWNAVIEYIKSEQNPSARGAYEEQTGTVFRVRPDQNALWVRCNTSVAADPFSIVEVYGGQLADDGLILQARQATSAAQFFAANEDYPLIAGTEGWVKLITPYSPVKVTAYGSPTWLSELVASGAKVQQGNGGQLLCIGTKDGAGRVAVLSTSGSLVLVGQTTATHVKGVTQTVNVFRGAVKGLETFTAGDTVQAYNRFATMAGGKWVGLAFINEGWELIAGEC
jgi:hypothetical protein